MNRAMTEKVLQEENRAFRGSGGVSAENRSGNFRPAFQDTQTGVVYASCYLDGIPAPFHLLDGLPDELVVARDPLGQRAALKASVISGFVRDGRFYTRDEAATLTSTPTRADRQSALSRVASSWAFSKTRKLSTGR
jgi:hypothetical protein